MSTRFTYSPDSLRREMREFEARYGISTQDFYRAHASGSIPPEISRFDEIVWLDAIERNRELTVPPGR